MGRYIADKFKEWALACDLRFEKLKANEEELNRIFLELYGLEDELTPEVADKDVTVRRADLQREIRSLISYAVGCLFGRYSLDEEGIVFAGGEWDVTRYKTVIPVADNILLVGSEDGEEDIVSRFVAFIKAAYGEDTLEENLRFIATALGGKGSAREVLRAYFTNGFYADHLKVYRKHPIYWLFDSGKKNGFKAYVYLHRYDAELLSRLENTYVRKRKASYHVRIGALQKRLATASAGERTEMKKQLDKLCEQAQELKAFEEKLHRLAVERIPLFLDDGVKVNYAKFGDLLAKIK